MFRQAAKKIAHNSTLPVLGGNKDLRTLQDLITAEKAVLHSYVICPNLRRGLTDGILPDYRGSAPT